MSTSSGPARTPNRFPVFDRLGLLVVAALATLFVSACKPAKLAPPSATPDAARGKQIYLGNCISCHNADPTKDGSIGPAVAGSPRDLIEARVLHGQYPPGYKPKRGTNVMQPLPFLQPNLDDIAAFLAAPQTQFNVALPTPGK